MSKNGRAALVTGSATGIGKTVALALARQGYDVAINYSRSEAEAKAAEAEAKSAGVRTLCIQADVSQDDEVRSMVAALEREFGRLDALVNVAGTTVLTAQEDLDA
ncbi:MAG: SDR family NAD(P)-dependent oxidoreductase, partial [Chloroflexi bacterium]|nr:SDR family NAD(P)-dependent oxidoreductase [Chloroflexota bacterium]